MFDITVVLFVGHPFMGFEPGITGAHRVHAPVDEHAETGKIEPAVIFFKHKINSLLKKMTHSFVNNGF
jgi:hypothetical protein